MGRNMTSSNLSKHMDEFGYNPGNETREDTLTIAEKISIANNAERYVLSGSDSDSSEYTALNALDSVLKYVETPKIDIVIDENKKEVIAEFLISDEQHFLAATYVEENGSGRVLQFSYSPNNDLDNRIKLGKPLNQTTFDSRIVGAKLENVLGIGNQKAGGRFERYRQTETPKGLANAYALNEMFDQGIFTAKELRSLDVDKFFK